MKKFLILAAVLALVVMAAAIYLNIGDIVERLMAAALTFVISVVLPAVFRRRSPEDETADRRLVAEGESTDRFKAQGHGGENR